MRIPARTQIGGHKIRVKHGDVKERGMLGECYSNKQLILIAPDSTKIQQEETYCHEIVEYANNLYELKLDHPTIQVLGAALHQALTSGEGRIGE